MRVWVFFIEGERGGGIECAGGCFGIDEQQRTVRERVSGELASSEKMFGVRSLHYGKSRSIFGICVFIWRGIIEK